MTPQRAAALAALRVLVAARVKSDAARVALRSVDPDCWSDFHSIPAEVEAAMVKLIDAVFEADGLAAYLLYETARMEDGGLIEFPDGSEYRIRTVEDVEALLEAEYPCR